MYNWTKIPRKISASAPKFPFQGGKSWLRDWLVPYFPRHIHAYIEPFAGRGNVFWLACQVCKCEYWWLNDLKMAPFFKAIMEVDPDSIPRRLSKADRDWLNEGM